jgi:hypothetical protein
MAAYTLYTALLFRKSTRGPPTVSLILIILIMAFTTVTTLGSRWIYHEVTGIMFSLWDACTCGRVPCDEVYNAMNSSFILGVIATILTFFSFFLATLRSVDHEGRTLKFASLFGFIALPFQLAQWSVFAGVFLSAQCGVKLSDWMNWRWGFSVAIAASFTQFFFIIFNLVYNIIPCCGCCGSRLDENKGRTIYQLAWWDELKDPRSIAHEGDEDDIDFASQEPYEK